MIEYKDIPGFPGYRAGSDGSVWSCRNNRWGFSNTWTKLTPTTNNKYGRKIIRLGRGTAKYLHHVILETFVGPRPSGCEALHKDGNAWNNSLENLRWGTREENLGDFRLHGRKKGEKHHRAKLTEAIVRRIRDRAASGETHQAIANSIGVQREAVGKIIRRERWNHIL